MMILAIVFGFGFITCAIGWWNETGRLEDTIIDRDHWRKMASDANRMSYRFKAMLDEYNATPVDGPGEKETERG
jgi:hypothetical protein